MARGIRNDIRGSTRKLVELRSLRVVYQSVINTKQFGAQINESLATKVTTKCP